ncbi:MAG: NAD(P)-binding protein [Verrucomicrobiae bacterium]|nr:NAD(P)-binding protein [Verrucomicrobiae bacterium]
MSADCDVAVVGGGPSGLAAATLAVELGLSVTLFDDQPRPGGQIYRGVESVAAHRPDHWSLLGSDYQAGLSLVEDFRGTDAVYRPGVVVWEVTEEGTLGITEDGAARIVSARRIIVAPGAMERPVPISGWTLPGVMGAGAAQTLLKASGLVPGVPTVLAGSGPLIFLVATQLVRLGAPPKAVLLTAPPANRRAAFAEIDSGVEIVNETTVMKT